MSWGEPRSYVTDDRDEPKRNILTIEQGGNGDWYVSVHPEGEGNCGRAVRICTSGGAANAVPGLGQAIADAYRALGKELMNVSIVEGVPQREVCPDCPDPRACRVAVKCLNACTCIESGYAPHDVDPDCPIDGKRP